MYKATVLLSAASLFQIALAATSAKVPAAQVPNVVVFPSGTALYTQAHAKGQSATTVCASVLKGIWALNGTPTGCPTSLTTENSVSAVSQDPF